MKRDILCPECAKSERRQFPTDNPYPGEYVKFVVGLANGNFNCDRCNAFMPANSACVAFSIYSDRIPYYAWEDDFITRTSDFDPAAAADKAAEDVFNFLDGKQ